MIAEVRLLLRALTFQHGLGVHRSSSRNHGPTNAAAASAVVVIDKPGLVWLPITRPQGSLNVFQNYVVLERRPYRQESQENQLLEAPGFDRDSETQQHHDPAQGT